MEGKILGAEERGRSLEYQLFQQLRDETLREIQFIQETASAIAKSRCHHVARGDGAAFSLLPSAAR